MTIATAWLALVLVGLNGPEMHPNPNAGDSDVVRRALKAEGDPWYDSRSDAVKPVMPSQEWDLEWLWDRLFGKWKPSGGGRSWFSGFGGAGDLLVIGLAVLVLSVLLATLFELWRRYQPIPIDSESVAEGIVSLRARIEGLPMGVRPETTDPWSEAQRLRELGDYAAAVVALFAHQLLALDRRSLIRLAPGRTGRQYVRSVGDDQLRDGVGTTLWLFESVYYGHRAPTREDFDWVWQQAEAFERRLAEGVTA